jgi:hypothetical protein
MFLIRRVPTRIFREWMSDMGFDISKFCRCEVRDGQEEKVSLASQETETVNALMSIRNLVIDT